MQREVWFSRGAAHMTFQLWDVSLVFLKWWGFWRYHWNGVDWGGGCLIIRCGPLVVNYWRTNGQPKSASRATRLKRSP